MKPGVSVLVDQAGSILHTCPRNTRFVFFSVFFVGFSCQQTGFGTAIKNELPLLKNLRGACFALRRPGEATNTAPQTEPWLSAREPWVLCGHGFGFLGFSTGRCHSWGVEFGPNCESIAGVAIPTANLFVQGSCICLRVVVFLRVLLLGGLKGEAKGNHPLSGALVLRLCHVLCTIKGRLEANRCPVQFGLDR